MSYLPRDVVFFKCKFARHSTGMGRVVDGGGCRVALAAMASPMEVLRRISSWGGEKRTIAIPRHIRARLMETKVKEQTQTSIVLCLSSLPSRARLVWRIISISQAERQNWIQTLVFTGDP